MTITATDIQLYKILKQKPGNKEAEVLVQFVDSKLKEADEKNCKVLSTKEDVKGLKLILKEDLKELELKLSVKISETKADIIRWFFVIVMPLVLAIPGLYFRR